MRTHAGPEVRPLEGKGGEGTPRSPELAIFRFPVQLRLLPGVYVIPLWGPGGNRKITIFKK